MLSLFIVLLLNQRVAITMRFFTRLNNLIDLLILNPFQEISILSPQAFTLISDL